MARFKVIRPHQGDVFYHEDDVREAQEGEVRHLVERGVLAKMEEAPANKAVMAAPRNKKARK